jgi:predicted phage terminase large subunit-like protein
MNSTPGENSPESAPSIKELDRAHYQSSLRAYIADAWRRVEPRPFVPGWHIDAITEHLEAVTSGQIRNLLINIPPRHMKSLQVGVFWPTWIWSRAPKTRLLYASYAASLSIRDAVKSRRLINSPWYQDLWSSRYHLAGDQNVKSRYDNDQGGYRIAAGTGGSVTGEGGDVLVIDDPHNVNEAESDIVRQGVIDWYDQVWSTRKNDAKESCEVIVMQRVHHGDLSAHVLAQGDWVHLCLPAEYDGRRCVTVLGVADQRMAEGDLLWPERFGPEEMVQLKKKLGPYGTSGQLQQSPTPRSGGLIKSHWLKRYARLESGFIVPCGDFEPAIDPASLFRFVTVDLAASMRELADYTVFGAWGYEAEKRRLFLLDIERDHIDGADKIGRLKSFMSRNGAVVAWIESVQFQLDFVQRVRAAGIAARELEADRDKIARVLVASSPLEAGQVFFPESAPWLVDYETEIGGFPLAEHDDMVDVTSYACLLINKPEMASLSLKYSGGSRLRRRAGPARRHRARGARAQTIGAARELRAACGELA